MQTDNGQVTYLDAISQALMSEMEADPDVFSRGEVGAIARGCDSIGALLSADG